jgi:hypothetical protein
MTMLKILKNFAIWLLEAPDSGINPRIRLCRPAKLGKRVIGKGFGLRLNYLVCCKN